MTNSNDKSGELLGQERRRRWSPEQKLAMVRESLQPGQSVSGAARQNGVNANQLFQWRKLYQSGSLSAVSAGESVVPASELADALKHRLALFLATNKTLFIAGVLEFEHDAIQHVDHRQRNIGTSSLALGLHFLCVDKLASHMRHARQPLYAGCNAKAL
ncbi:transposase-like protein [Pseudomonas sp. BE134]|nr:transposase-like protein [Pseudomonas sp. BE134]